MASQNTRESSGLAVVQIALNTNDLAGTMRLYSELFGFANAGGDAIWGSTMSVQGLDASARALIWWLVGRQRDFQLELFQHTNPKQKPQPQDWKPSDHGWVRFGVAVGDFDAAMACLDRWRIAPLASPITVAGLRRVAIRDPFVGAIIEIMEDGAALPGGIRDKARDLDPAAVYVTSSVADLDGTRLFYEGALGLKTAPRDLLHSPAHEALWGLENEKPRGFVVPMGDVFIEVLEYANGRPQPADYSLVDQGMMNIGLGSREIAIMRGVVDWAQKAGIRITKLHGGQEWMTTYLTSAGREFELMVLPKGAASKFGFEPVTPFLGLSKF
jgi:catechol 2,3-dioxygenase-like lactoylglutathione lyase family enzyme